MIRSPAKAKTVIVSDGWSSPEKAPPLGPESPTESTKIQRKSHHHRRSSSLVSQITRRISRTELTRGSSFLAPKHNQRDVIAVACASEGTELWDVKAGKKIGSIAGCGVSTIVQYSSNGKWLAVGHDQVRVYALPSLRESRSLEPDAGLVSCIAFDKTDRFMAVGTLNGATLVYDFGAGECVARLSGHSKSVYSVSFAPDSLSLASGGVDGRIMVYGFDTSAKPSFKLLDTIKTPSPILSGMSFSPTTKNRLVSGHKDGVVRVWDLSAKDGAVQELRGHKGVVNHVAWRPDGRCILSVSTDNTIRLWVAKDGRKSRLQRAEFASEAVIHGHNAWIYSCRFLGSDNKFVTASHDQTSRIWDMKGVCLNVLKHSDRARSLAAVA